MSTHSEVAGRSIRDLLRLPPHNPTTPHSANCSSWSSKLQVFAMSTTSITPAHVRTRFLIISDTHSTSPSDNVASNKASFRPPLPKADVLLHCGDLTMIGHLEEYEKTLDMLESIDADLKLVIAGNHDITLDEAYYERKGEYMHRGDRYDKDLPRRAREIWKGERAKKAGVTYLEEGTHAFQLQNGANLRVCALLYNPALYSELTTPRSTRLPTNRSSATMPSRTSAMKTVTTLLISAHQTPNLSPRTPFQTSPTSMS